MDITIDNSDKEAKVVYVDALSAYAHQIGEAINYATKFDNKEKRDELHNKLMEFANAVKK
jgi:hemerythrin-like domain-containing protein